MQRKKRKENGHWQYESPQQVRDLLREMAEPEYQAFASRLLPAEKSVWGVRLPKLRRLAKQIAACDWQSWLSHEEDCCFEETMLRGMVIGYGGAHAELETVWAACRAFVPRIQNWSVCDSFCATLKVIEKNREAGWEFLQPYAHSSREFEARVAAVLLLDYYLTPEWIDRALVLLSQIRQQDYYAKMAVAWAYSMAYIRFPEKTGPYLEEGVLDPDTRKKALQKIRESRQKPKFQKDVTL